MSVIEIVANFIDAMLFMFFIKGRHECKKLPEVILLPCMIVLLTFFASVEFLFHISNTGFSLVYFGVILVYICFLCDGKAGKKIVTFLLLIAITVIVNLSAYAMVNYAFIDIGANDATKMVRISILVVDKLMLFSVFVIANTFTSDVRLERKEILTILMIVTLFAVASISCTSVVEKNSNINYLGLLIVCIIIVLIYLLMAISTLYISVKRYAKDRDEIINAKEQQLEREIELVNSKYMEIKQLRHDIKGYLDDALHKAEEVGSLELTNHIHLLIDDVESKGFVLRYSDCERLNNLLYEKESICKEKDIPFSIEGFYKNGKIQETDISFIISDLINNAIEYCESIPKEKRFIKVSFSEQGDYVRIMVKNGILESVKQKMISAIDDKGWYKLRGLGLMSVKKKVELYDGEFQIYENDNGNEIIVDCLMVNK